MDISKVLMNRQSQCAVISWLYIALHANYFEWPKYETWRTIVASSNDKYPL